MTRRPPFSFVAGLDSFAALNVMEHMSNLADLGHTIIASIHQPRSAIWDMFDKVTRPHHAQT
jgi:ABC-type multidrug transport system ATPase subunit